MSRYLESLVLVRRPQLGLAVAFASLFVVTTPAVAAGKRVSEGNQAQERAARKACLSGDYATGVSILSDLFIDTRDPTHVFNQGRCFEQNRRYEDAIARFEEYLHLPNASLSAEDRAAAEVRIANCKEKLPPDRSAGAATAPQAFIPTVGAKPPEPETAPAQEPAPSTPTVETHANAGEQAGAGLRTTGIVLASVGVAALAGGVLFNVKANSMTNDWESKVSYTDSQNSTHKTYKTLSWVGYGAGAACLVTGAVLWAVGRSQRDNSTSVALLPSVGPGHAGALLTGGF